MSIPEAEARLETHENDNQAAPHRTFWKHPGSGHHYAGSYADLDDKEVEWNDKIRSVTLYGPPGTTVWMYDSKGFKGNDDVIEIRIPDGAESVVSNQLNTDHPAGVRWIKYKNGIAGKVSGIQWK